MGGQNRRLTALTVPFLRSALRDMVWPALPVSPGAAALALQYQLRRSERLDAETLQAQQFTQLQQLLAHCDRTMPFWRTRLRAAGIQPGDKLTAENWAGIPVLRACQLSTARFDRRSLGLIV